MPLFNNSSSNIPPEVDSEIPIDELPKIDGRRRLSFKKSFFVWSTQKQILDRNKFIFDSNSMIQSGKGKESRHDSYIIKSKKYNTRGSINYDESDNDYSSESDIDENEENEKKDYYSMEDLDNITALKKKYPKIRNVPPLSESTLCYSSNTNTINTISLEFSQKSRLISNNDINYGLCDNQNNEGILNINKEDKNIGENSGNNGNDENKSNINVIDGQKESNEENKKENNEENKIETNEENKIENNEENKEENNEENNGEDSEEGSIDDYEKSSDQSNNIDDINIDNIDKVYNFDFEEYYESDIEENENKYSLPLSKNKKRESKKTVTFSDNIVIIESLKPQKARNIFKRAISKIIKKKT